ncbi:MAG TPA: hypothetical protein VMU16_02445 [Candidatus Binataceae bacterium]|nr:hypothetical protein [Candidatus Binataceae bacterium]
MENSQIPTVGAIQRMNLIVVAVVAAALAAFVSASAAIGCLLGGGVVIASLWLNSLLVGLVLAAAGSGISGTSAKLGALAIPLKLLLVGALVYLLFNHTKIDGLGFTFGVLTQMTAAIIETGRASFRRPV